MTKRIASIIALCALVLLGFADPSDAAPMGPPSVECQLQGGEWVDDPDSDDPDDGECCFEVTTTTEPETTTTTWPQVTITVPETTTTTEPETTTVPTPTTVPESTTTTTPVPTTAAPSTTTTGPRTVVTVSDTPSPSNELAHTGSNRRFLWMLTAVASLLTAWGASILLAKEVGRQSA